ncbi:MAG TPA: hypothetical protein VHS28_03740 [Chloroflexota bacterium]|nr:hypothetical protein [Chloroflexota bacterium]
MEDKEASEAIKALVRTRRELLGMTVGVLAEKAGVSLSDLEALDFATEPEYSDTLVKLDEALQWRLGSIERLWKFRSVGSIGWDLVPEMADVPPTEEGASAWADIFSEKNARPAAHLSDAELAAELTYRLLSRSGEDTR